MDLHHARIRLLHSKHEATISCTNRAEWLCPHSVNAAVQKKSNSLFKFLDNDIHKSPVEDLWKPYHMGRLIFKWISFFINPIWWYWHTLCVTFGLGLPQRGMGYMWKCSLGYSIWNLHSHCIRPFSTVGVQVSNWVPWDWCCFHTSLSLTTLLCDPCLQFHTNTERCCCNMAHSRVASLPSWIEVNCMRYAPVGKSGKAIHLLAICCLRLVILKW